MIKNRYQSLFPIMLITALLGNYGLAHAVNVADGSAIELIDEEGEGVSMESYSGYQRMVFFGYTYCPDICPLTLHYVATALRSLGPLAEQTKVLFVSVDPKRDTPQILHKYTDAFHPSIIGLTGSYDQIAKTASRFRTTFGYTMKIDGKERSLGKNDYQQISAKAYYEPYHSSQIYLLDPNGEIEDIIGYGSTPDFIEAKLRELLNK